MPKKLNAAELLKGLKKAKDDEPRPVSTRIPVRCLRPLLERCAQDSLDLAQVVREIIEGHVAGQTLVALPKDAEEWLGAAVARVRQAYKDGVSPIDALIAEPLRKDPFSKEHYQGPLAPLIAAAIASVPVQEILDGRTLSMVEEQRRRTRETFAQRLWREELPRAPGHVRPHAEKLHQLELDFHARLKLGWNPGPDDEDSGPPPLYWWFDEWVIDQIKKGDKADDNVKSVQLLMRAGYLTAEPNRPNSYKWEGE